jgi:hypothetical protein
VNLAQLQGQISTLTKNIQELTIPKPGRPQVWCIGCYTKGHLVNECPRIRGLGPPQSLTITPRGPMGGFAQVPMNSPFHHPTPYHAFPGGHAKPTMEYCEICRTLGHGLRQCPIMQKYSTVPNIVHCDFYASTTHTTNQCRVLDALADMLDRTTFRVNENPQGPGRGRGGGARGDFRGGRTGGRGPSICYNYDEQGQLARYFPHPR